MRRSLHLNTAVPASPAHGDGGFTLMEAAIATLIASILFVGVTVALGAGFRHAEENRRQQQATALSLEGIEIARSLAWDELAITPGVASGDPLLKVVGSDRYLDAALADLPADELLVEEGGADPVPGALLPYQRLELLDGAQYTIRHYVTDAGDDLRRVVVAVEWEWAGVPHRQMSSTLVAEAAVS